VIAWEVRGFFRDKPNLIKFLDEITAYALSLRNLEEMMAERGVQVDHATVHRWALKILPVLAKVFRRRKHPVGRSWRMDETYIQVGGQWKYLYRAVDRLGHTVDFLLTAKSDHAAARRFFERAIGLHVSASLKPSCKLFIFYPTRSKPFEARHCLRRVDQIIPGRRSRQPIANNFFLVHLMDHLFR